MIELTVNGSVHKVDVPEDAPLLWVLREELGIQGPKFGCGKSLCGACSVLVDGESVRSCVTGVGAVTGKQITTIEGLADGEDLHEVQRAWLRHNVPQCGYCQPGQIVSAVALLNKNPHPTSHEIRQAMSGNICRCGTYPRIEKAIVAAAAELSSGRNK